MSDRRILPGASGLQNQRNGGSRRGIALPFSQKLRSMTALSEVPYQLDDLALEGIKASLSPLEAIFFEPLSSRFAFIKVRQCRLSLRASILCDLDSPDDFLLTILDRKGRKSQILAEKNNIASLLMHVLSRIYKFETIAVSLVDVTAIDTEEHGEVLLKSLLTAALENDLTDIWRFELLIDHKFSVTIDSVAAWISQISPSLHHLVMDCSYSTDTSQQQYSTMLTAIGSCDQLRSVELFAVGRLLPEVWLELVDVICARPKLNALRIIGHKTGLPVKHCFDMDINLLQRCIEHAIDRPSVKQFLGRINTCTYWDSNASYFPQCLDDSDVALVVKIASSLRSLPKFVVRMQTPYPRYLTWSSETLDNWLLIASGCRALIKIFIPSVFALPTVEQFASITEAIAVANIHGLKPLPVHNPQQMTFSFTNGSKVQLLME